MNKIEHIGIAVKDLKAASITYEKLLNSTVYKTEEVASEGVITTFLQCGPNKIELLEATSINSPIAKFIEKRGEGVHHIAFEVDDIKAEMQRLKDEGFVLLNEEPKRGADNKWVCFVHPKGMNGVLVELCQSLNVNVVDKYEIKFFKKLFFDEYFDSMESTNPTLNQFITDYRTPVGVNDYLIHFLNNVLSNISDKEILFSESMVALEANLNISKFYRDVNYSSDDLPDFVIPTIEFKEIAKAWMNYLENNK